LNGRVDPANRALVDVAVRRSVAASPTVTTVWVDTAFNGYFVFPPKLIEDLEREQEAATDAILADGSRVTLESFICYVEWFDRIVAAQVVANDGNLPLLGTELLASHKLLVDYAVGIVSID
jgi:predicted aspartyl protease